AESPLVYFVDAGHGGDSQTRSYSTLQTESRAYSGVETLADATLRNAVPDQRYLAGSTDWGWTSSSTDNYKISVT
ncbi:hypothetical protein, partial [Schumannella sp. 10F1B-5-1]